MRVSLLLALPISLSLSGCGFNCLVDECGGGSPPPPGGFSVAIQDSFAGAPAGFGSGTITGSWASDLSNPVGATKSFNVLAGKNAVFISGGRAPANWTGTDTPSDCSVGTLDWQGSIQLNGLFTVATCNVGSFGDSFFVLANSLPASVTLKGSGLTTTSGMPELDVYGFNQGLISQTAATSVGAGGTSATFPFPKNSLTGEPLTTGHYALHIDNQTSPGVFAFNGADLFSIGTTTTYTSPYGVDAFDGTVTTVTCATRTGQCVTQGPTNYSGTAVTQLTANQVCLNGCFSVGTMPIAIRTYGAGQIVTGHGNQNQGVTTTTTQPEYAIVANFGSNNASIVNLVTNTTVTSLAVGTEPIAVVLNQAKTLAYVANYGSSSVTVVNLSSNSVTGAIAVGASPAALALDPSGSYLWVGGLNYISKINLSNNTVASTMPATGYVTSLAISTGQNAIVYTTVNTSLTSYQTEHASLSTGSIIKSYAAASISGTPYGSTSPAPPGYLLSSAATVSSGFGNRYAVTGTPTGFAVIDLQTQTTMMSGSTTNPVRGIATDSNLGMIYLTVPASNSLISVPYPPGQ
jgi:YVTN family beta-propeller protein